MTAQAGELMPMRRDSGKKGKPVGEGLFADGVSGGMVLRSLNTIASSLSPTRLLVESNPEPRDRTREITRILGAI